MMVLPDDPAEIDRGSPGQEARIAARSGCWYATRSGRRDDQTDALRPECLPSGGRTERLMRFPIHPSPANHRATSGICRQNWNRQVSHQDCAYI